MRSSPWAFGDYFTIITVQWLWVLKEAGAWLKVNGEAIDGTHPVKPSNWTYPFFRSGKPRNRICRSLPHRATSRLYFGLN